MELTELIDREPVDRVRLSVAQRPELSLVIPAFDEARRLPGSLRAALTFLEAHGRPFEVIVVDDGSRDDTAGVATEILAPLGGRGRLLRLAPNRGKGAAVRTGVRAALGDQVLVSDADLSTPIEELARLERAHLEGNDIVIGSRAVAGANIEVHQPVFRESMGRFFNLLVRLLLVPSLHDTQCGFKLFSREAALGAFSRARLDGFSFDVEVLFIATRQGRRIAEVPVTWRNDAASRVTLGRGVMAFLDLLRIRSNSLAGRYRA
jgi:dolichyl-phosphate beta-glucosyltransferase